MQTTRKLLIILMLFLMIFCISGVSASDNVDNLTVSQDTIMLSGDDDVISSVDDEVVSSADKDIVDVLYKEFEYDDYVIVVSDNYFEGESGLFGIGHYSDDKGNVTYIIDNETIYNSTSFRYDYHTGGNFINIDDLNLSYGQHQYKIAFDASFYFDDVTFTGTFNYDYIRIIVPDNTLYVDEYGNSYNQYIKIVLSPLVTGNIEVIFNNKTIYSKAINDTNITIDLNILSPGTYDYQVIYSEGNHDDFIQTGMIKKDYPFEINNRTDDLMNETIFELVLPADANSVVTVGLDNETYVANITSGFGKITFNNSEILNERFVTFSYEDEKYPLKTIEMDLKDYSFVIENKIDNIRYESTFEFVLPADANSVVTVGLDNETYAVNLTSGRGKITFNNSEILNESLISFSYEDENHPSKKIEIDLTQLNILTRSTDKRSSINYNLAASSFYFDGESKILGIEPKDNYEVIHVNGKAIYEIADKRFDSIGDVIILIDGEEFYRDSLCDYYIYQEVVDYTYDGIPIYETIEEYGGNFLYMGNLGLSYGEHEYQIIYTGNDIYRGFIINGTFNYDFIKVDCPMEVYPPIDYYDVAYTSTCRIKLQFSPLVTGNIEVLFDNESYLNESITSSNMYVVFHNGNGLFEMLDVGTHECRIIYSGGNHDDRIINTTFLLDYGFPFNINYESDNNVNYETSFYFDIDDMTRFENGVVTIDLGNKSYRVNLTSDHKNHIFIGNITLSNSEILAADSIIFSVKSPEYPLKKIEMNTSQLNLKEYPFEIDNKIDNFRYETAFEFALPDDANSVVTIGLGNETYATNVTSGKGKITFNNSELLNKDIISFSYVDEKYPLRAIEINLTQLNILTWSTDKRLSIRYDLAVSSFYFEGESETLGIEPKDNYEVIHENGKTIYEIDDKRFDSIGDVIILIDGEELYRDSLCDYYIYRDVIGYSYEGYYPTPIYQTFEEYGGNFLDMGNLGLSYGEHEYQIIYTGNDIYRGVIINGTFNYDFIKVDCPMKVHPPIFDYEVAIKFTSEINLYFSPLLTGNIEVLFDNESYLNESITSSNMYVVFHNGYGLFEMLDVGTHECRIIYSGGNHDDRIINTTFLLDYGYPFNINYESDNSVNYETSFYFDIDDKAPLENGVVTIDLGNKSYRVNLTSEHKNHIFIGNITLSNSEILAADSIIFSVKSPESPLMKIEMNTSQLNLSVKTQPVLKQNATVDVTVPSDIAVGDDSNVNVKLPGDATGNVTLKVDGEVVDTVPVTDDILILTIPSLKAGNHTVEISYYGDDKYNPVSETKDITVSKQDTTPEVDVDGSNVVVSLPSDATGTVTLTINGKDEVFNVVNGKANVKLPDLGNGNYPYTITYSGDSKYSSFNSSSTLSVNKTQTNPTENVTDNTKITASPTKVTYNAGSYYKITVYGADGKLADGVKVVVTIKGKPFKTLTTTNGVAKFKVTKYPGTYKLNITALGKSVTKTLTVKHLVTLKSVTLKKFAKKLTLQATLAKVKGKYLKKKTITFKINGKKVTTAKTNNKGVAKITIKNPSVVKNLKVGKKVTYQATYLKDTVKKTTKIKK